MNKRTLYHGDTFDLDGHSFRVSFEHDGDQGVPWKECDGHGIVSEWTHRAKRPGERILCSDRGAHLFYDVQATMHKALAEKWGPNNPALSPRQQAAAAVEADFDYLYAFCNDQWQYVGVTVELLDDESEPIASNGLWGVETWKDYHSECAYDMAADLLARHKAENEEREHWEARDVETHA
jgi:hypothetical protein